MEAHKAAVRRRAAALRRAATAAWILVAAEVLRLGALGLRLVVSLGLPLPSFYRWKRPLGHPNTFPQVWESSGRFQPKETY